MPKLLSIIVPVYNVEKYLERCIRSIMNQGLREEDFEVIIVNDGSTDASLEIAKSLKKEFQTFDIKIISQSNQGLSCARNTGMKYATGEYLEFIDSDDYLEPKSIREIIDLAIKTKVEVLAFRMKVLDKDGNERISRSQPFPSNRILSAREILVKNLYIGSACNHLYRKDFLLEKGIKFEKGITHEDVAFNSCVYSCVNKIMFTDFNPYVYYWNADSMNRSNNYDKIRKAIIDNLYVIRSVMSFLNKNNASTKVKRYFNRHGNSIIVGSIINFISNKSLPKEIKIEFINKAKELNLYPIKGRTQSLKTTLLIPLFNEEHFISHFF